ncbi:MAG: hypothetical protein WCD18_24890 [Thermosynechococcaceae cyanobacterium]
MLHRHLTLNQSQRWCLPALEDIILRGNLSEWLDLLQTLAEDSSKEIARKIQSLCASNPDAAEQSYRFFEQYLHAGTVKNWEASSVVSWTETVLNALQCPDNMKTTDWEQILSAASMLQQRLPDAVLVGGTAAALHAQHRISYDADHVVSNLRERFEAVLADLESVSGWQTARVRRPVLILGSLEGIETGVRQLIRNRPLETEVIQVKGQSIVIPTIAEMLRIKTLLVLKRNATRDYIDVAALSATMGLAASVEALLPMDAYYPQSIEGSVRQQVLRQLAAPLPYDLDGTDLSIYKKLDLQWQSWQNVSGQCVQLTQSLAQKLLQQKRSRDPGL